MSLRIFFVFVSLLVTFGRSAAVAQQRVEFERKKFDRSRFDHPGQAVSAPTASPAPAEPAFPVTPAAMVTEPPAAAAHADAASAVPPTNTAIFSANSSLPAHHPPPSPYPADVTPEEKAVIDTPLFDQLPAKDFNNAKDHDDLLALQKKTGACMIVYFKNPSVPNEKGLCSWFEKSVTTDIKWRKAMKYYLQLEINLPGNSVVENLVAQYRAGKTPALFVVKPGSTTPVRLRLFDYPAGSRPVPIEAEVVLQTLKAASTPAYQTLF
jgi:hypothetical protein